MSTWIEVTDIDDVEIDGDDINILYDHSPNGNNYITVPVHLMVRVLRDSGIIPVKVA